MPKAIQYGMTPNQFWDDDGTLFYAYEKAYITKIHTESHIQGMYNYLALETIFSNAFAKKGSKKIEYPDKAIFSPYDENYLKKKNIKEMTEKEKDQVYRKKMSFWNKFVSDKKKTKKKEGENS